MLSFSPAWGIAQQLASGLYRNLSEFVRTCAIYLGIAVLVAATMVLTMPTLRGQALQMHSALLYALVPEALVPRGTTNTSAPVGPIVSAVDLEPIRGETLPASASTRPLVVASGPVTPLATSRADLALPTASRPPPAVEQPADTAAKETAAKNAQTPGALMQQGLTGTTEVASARGSNLEQALQRQALSKKQQDALVQYLSRKYLVANEAAKMFVETAYLVGDELKVDPLLILAIIATESRFNPYAGGPSGGPTGLMQVMISSHRDKFAKFERGETMVFNPVANIRVGAFILADCIRRRGSIAQGLLCYCGASSPTADGGYTEKVLSERRRLALAGSIALKD